MYRCWTLDYWFKWPWAAPDRDRESCSAASRCGGLARKVASADWDFVRRSSRVKANRSPETMTLRADTSRAADTIVTRLIGTKARPPRHRPDLQPILSRSYTRGHFFFFVDHERCICAVSLECIDCESAWFARRQLGREIPTCALTVNRFAVVFHEKICGSC